MAVAGAELPRHVLVEIPPFGIVLLDQFQLPSSRPLLQTILTMDGCENVFEWLTMNKYFDAIFACKSADQSFAMFPGATHDVVRHAYIERAVAPARHDVNPI